MRFITQMLWLSLLATGCMALGSTAVGCGNEIPVIEKQPYYGHPATGSNPTPTAEPDPTATPDGVAAQNVL